MNQTLTQAVIPAELLQNVYGGHTTLKGLEGDANWEPKILEGGAVWEEKILKGLEGDAAWEQ